MGFSVAVMLDKQQVRPWLIIDADAIWANLTSINDTSAVTILTVCSCFAAKCFYFSMFQGG